MVLPGMLTLLFPLLTGATFSVEVKLEGKPLARQKVEVFGFKEGEQRLRLDAETNSSGRAQFEIKSPDEINVAARTIFENIGYYTGIYASGDLPQRPVPIEVHKTAVSDPNVMISDVRIFLTQTPEGLKIDEEMVVENSSRFTIVGAGHNKEEPGEVFRFSLPTGAFDLRFNSGFDEKETRFEGNDIIVTRPLVPGTTRFNISYVLEKATVSFSFAQNFSLPLDSLSFGTDIPRLNISGLPFINSGQKFVEGKNSDLFEADLEKSTSLKFKVAGLPLQIPLSKFLPILAFLVMAVLAIFFSKTAEPKEDASQKNSLLKDLHFLNRLRSEKLVSEMEYQRKKLRLIEALAPFYESASSH